jgi:exocyst complex component 4
LTSPFHKENYSQLVLTVIIQFYQRCSDRFQDSIVTKDDTTAESKRVTLAAEWAQKQDLQPCLSEIMRLPVSASEQ